MLDLDFEPAKVTNGVFITKATVVFCNECFSVMNVSESDIQSNWRKVVGYANEIGETLSYLSMDLINNLKTSKLDNLTGHLVGAKFGDNLSAKEKSALLDLIQKHARILRSPVKLQLSIQ